MGPFYWRLNEQSLTQITCQQTGITLPLQNCEKEGPLTKLVYLKSHHVSSYLYHYLDQPNDFYLCNSVTKHGLRLHREKEFSQDSAVNHNSNQTLNNLASYTNIGNQYLNSQLTILNRLYYLQFDEGYLLAVIAAASVHSV